jgi:hypothetical protein
MITISTITIVVIVAAVIVVAVLVIGLMTVLRRRRLQLRFGPEYDRLVGDRDSKLKAESELTRRERRVHRLDIQPLTGSARASYALQWAGIQEQFVDTPADAVASSQRLVSAVMSELGYPADDQDQLLADLSVDHAAALDQYRAAQSTSESSTAGAASTEDLRLAMINYRALFHDLTGESADTGTGSAPAEPAHAIGAADTPPEGSDVRLAETQPDMDPGDPATDGPGQQQSRTTERELTR